MADSDYSPGLENQHSSLAEDPQRGSREASRVYSEVVTKLLTVSYPLLGMSDHLFVYFGPDFSATFSLLAITTTAIPKINVSQNLRFGGETRHM